MGQGTVITTVLHTLATLLGKMGMCLRNCLDKTNTVPRPVSRPKCFCFLWPLQATDLRSA